jgi:hypothetical protein
MDTLALKPITVACINALIASLKSHEGGFSDEEIADLLHAHMIDPHGNPLAEEREIPRRTPHASVTLFM